jgi:hypothetical protein
MQKRKMPRDPNQRAKLIADMVYGEAEPEPTPAKDPAAVARGRAGGLIGGKARAAKLTPEQRRASAKKAAQSRWG